ncbi:hypothetical protein HPHPH6_0081 [Helicobacter pylori Hp H-6]|uniref:Uncharacterized protein n=1 Tax=Helicobacter pylori Hp H-6 TaxID=992061 RepID=I9URX6_HELPX|nr:hypothetical protein HPHPH6_0081 [Helicobacter pylori Hp H-6]
MTKTRFFNTLFFKLLPQNNRYLTLLINFRAFDYALSFRTHSLKTF